MTHSFPTRRSSDLTLGNAAAAAAVALGARVFEKHFTLDRSMKGPDHSYALEPAELKAYVQTVSDAYAALGSPAKAMLDDERKVGRRNGRSEEHTSELQSLMRISYAVFCLKKTTLRITQQRTVHTTLQDHTT